MLLLAPVALAGDKLEFAFDDEEGHLLVRFVGLGPEGLSATQRDEVVNAEVSSMVHDHLRADLKFESEPVDSEWAWTTEARIRSYFADPDSAFDTVEIECRSDSCRIRMHHSVRWNMTQHQARLDQFSLLIDSLIEDNPSSFESTYMIAAYEKSRYSPHIKGYLHRCTRC
jgi:hypothetical protein